MKIKITDIPRIINHRISRKRIQKHINKHQEDIKKLKDMYNGNRCFIIGNGPSLTVEDLEKLDKEITFGSHGIYYIYNQTDWRPTFYCAQDFKLICDRIDEINDLCNDSICIFGVSRYPVYPKFKKNSLLINLKVKNDEERMPFFSDDLSKCAYEGYTVTYFCMQLAIYMGFKEIYLLGIDHFYSGGKDDHFSEKDTVVNIPQLDKSTLAYVKAKEYAEEHNVKIYNATRGGHLEVFERIDLDKLFKNI